MEVESPALAITRKTNEVILDPVARSLEVASSAVQIYVKLLQGGIELGQANLQAWRNYLEAVQRTSLAGADALTELSASTAKAAIKWNESVQAALVGTASSRPS
jgi:hypothetical protein